MRARWLWSVFWLCACQGPSRGPPGRDGGRPPQDASALARTPLDTAFLDQWIATGRFSRGQPQNITVAPDGSAVFYLRSGPRDPTRALWVWDPATRAERMLASAETLLRGAAETLTPEERARRERQRIVGRGLSNYLLAPDGTRVLVPFSGRLFVLERSSGTVRELDSSAGTASDARFSPDGAKVSWVRGGEVYVTDLASGRQTRVTTGATRDLTHGTAEFVAQEEMDRDEGYWWSPDGRSLAIQETDTRAVERLRCSDPSHPENPPEEPAYPRAGRENAVVRLGLYPAAGGAPRWVRWDQARYPYLAAVRWTERAPLTLVVQNRPQTEELVLAVDTATGASRTLLTETDAAWINLDEAMPRWLPDGSGFLWSSERNGRWQVELRGPDGALQRTLTAPALNYRKLLSLDFAHRRLWLQAGDDPTETQLVRVSLDSGAVERLTDARAEHDAWVSRDGGSSVRSVATLDAPAVWNVVRDDGTVLGAVPSVAEAPPWWPRVELSTTGALGIHTALVRPRDFDPRRRYPVLVNVYGGPHARMVTHAPGRYFTAQWLADQGFVVLLADGRGTPARGREWERALKLHTADVPLEDQVDALAGTARQEPSMDLSRVGVHGWSYGGYLAGYAVLARPDVFHAAVAGAPVADWRDYDTHYTERYLGHPEVQRAAYEAASLLPRAATLARPLLLVHGTADDNVYLLHSLRLVQALVEHNRTFDYLPLPGATHMVTAAAHNRALYTRMVEFFRAHLGPPR